MEPCPTCGHTPAPHPSQWLTPPDAALAGFMASRLAEDRDVLEASVDAARGTDGWAFAVRVTDHVTCIQSVVRAYEWTRDPHARAVVRHLVLTLAQPYEQHPDFDPTWMTELLGERN